MSKKEKSVGEFIGTALISYVATNADDLVILMNFFTEATLTNSSIQVRDIIIGQYLGFVILLGISLIGYGISYAVPVQMLGFLGFIPILLGIKGLIEILHEQIHKSENNLNAIIPHDDISIIELQTIRYRNDSNEQILFQLTTRQNDEPIIQTSSTPKFKEKIMKYLSYCLNIQTLKIAGITLANSGDNVAIYTPLFAQASQWQIGGYIGIFLFMVLIWLIVSYYFIHFHPILSFAQKYAQYIVPIVFMAIGVYILITSDCFPWIRKAIQTKNFKNG